MQRPKEIAIALLVGALIAGAALGYAASHYVSAREGAPGERGAMRHYLAAKLDLTPAQSAGVDSILDARHREMTRIIAPVQPQLDSARATARKQIMALLNADQQRRFQELVRERDKAAEANHK
jgi:Spy/CpxP family protein refolding chaperone